MSTKLTKLHDTTLAIRLPKALHDQLEQVATTQYMKVSELVRHLIKEHLKQAQPFINPHTQTQVQLQGKFNPQRFKTPAEQKAYEDEWDY
jgi:Arc/MetJ-type ribon-helix-helix transcriptional regulator